MGGNNNDLEGKNVSTLALEVPISCLTAGTEPVQTCFPAALAPTNFPRTDLVNVFLKGISGVNQPANVVSAEMLRLNTAVPVTAAASQNPLGVVAGDNAGFPNGRRPDDEVVDLSLRVSEGRRRSWRLAASGGGRSIVGRAVSTAVPEWVHRRLRCRP